ncbi:sensor histidine kinase [Peptoniphilus sp. MSJ-1]|uniref:histidine kinase n=1 Tax=Peptoniphilus ovalis TaxID=2841503 RepID=A0ABS6FGH2_9FIRM|nr:sensor histidine kinase [Peptoniphilus ovalis]MBU5668563.1 sensor histidine kinase [Peptoniphilus ovalis]
MYRLSISDFIKKEKYIISFGFAVFIYIFLFSLFLMNSINLSIYMSLCYLILLFIFLIFLYNEKNKIHNEEITWLNRKEFDEDLPNADSKLVDEIKRLNKKIIDFKNLEKTNNYKIKDYLTVWTHQIKSPIFALRLLLKQDEINISECNKKIFEIEEYISNILGYVRLNSNSTDYVFDKISLDEIIRDVIRKYSIQFIGKNNSVEFKETNKLILTDAKWFSFLLEQIISNSCKYTENGEISIYIEDDELVIEDSGIGIIKEDIPRIFDQGYTGYNGRLMKKSTGLGLNLAKEIGKSLRLNLRCESEVNKFTKIYIDLKNVME